MSFLIIRGSKHATNLETFDFEVRHSDSRDLLEERTRETVGEEKEGIDTIRTARELYEGFAEDVVGMIVTLCRGVRVACDYRPSADFITDRCRLCQTAPAAHVFLIPLTCVYRILFAFLTRNVCFGTITSL